MTSDPWWLEKIALLAGLFLIGVLGCARPLTYVDLAPMSFEDESAPINGTIELCLSRKIRKRQWNVKDHPYKIELGGRAAQNIEIMAKSAFREVLVSFDDTCGSATHYRWLDVRIVAANRDWDSLWATEQNTTITLSLDLFEDDGREIWSTTTRGDVKSKPAWFTRRRTRGAKDFGQAISLALQQGFEELIASEEIRSAFRDTQLDSPDEVPSP